MTCGILGHERDSLEKIFSIVKRAYTNLPEFIKPKTRTDTKRQYDFKTRFDGEPLDSSIYVALKLRSGTTQKLHVTESAFIKDRQELNAGSKQAVPMTGSISEETTGNGFNDFFDSFTEADNNPNVGELDYKTYFYPWFDNPEYTLEGKLEGVTTEEEKLKANFGLSEGQILWRRWKMKELKTGERGLMGLSGDQLFKQEYPSTKSEAFQSGAGSVFDAERIDAVIPHNLLLGSAKALVDKGFKIWGDVIPKKNYIIGVDPSDGEGADASCIDVWEKDSLEQVAQYYGKLRPDELAELIKITAEYYNHAFVGVENNMLTTILWLSKIYDNYYFANVIDERTAKRTRKIGWNTNSKTRDVMIDDFIIAFEQGVLGINSTITLKEMKTFVKKDNGKREHADGKHDDSLFAGFIALQMRKYWKGEVRTFASAQDIGF
jgi:hypothetical protein